LTGCRFEYEAAVYEAAFYEAAVYEAAYLSLMMSILLNTWELAICRLIGWKRPTGILQPAGKTSAMQNNTGTMQ